jgi:uncharacterized protein YjgD (DUF1641 family)
METMTVGRGKGGRDDALTRIEARLERIESMLGRFEQVADQLPGMAAMTGDIVDEWAAEDGHADARLRALTHLLDRLTKPEILHALTVLVEQVEAAPGLVAMTADIVDEIAAQTAAEGVDLQQLTENLGKAARGLILLASRDEILEVLDSDMFDPGALRTLASAARAMADATDGATEPQRVGVFGTLGALRDPDVQKALGFAVRVAKGFGQTLEDGDGAPRRQLTAG